MRSGRPQISLSSKFSSPTTSPGGHDQADGATETSFPGGPALCRYDDRRILEVVTALRQADLHATLEFLREAEAVTGPTPFPSELLELLRGLVPCDLVNFCELDRWRKRLICDTHST